VTGPLISNHFHLLVETPQPNLVAGMKWLLGTCTSRFNRRHGEFGHVFSGRYKSLIVDGSGNGYIKSVCDYVHLNPVRARQRRRADHYGPELREADLAHAERLVKTNYDNEAGGRPIWACDARATRRKFRWRANCERRRP
jgi:hypothetical protein